MRRHFGGAMLALCLFHVCEPGLSQDQGRPGADTSEKQGKVLSKVERIPEFQGAFSYQAFPDRATVRDVEKRSEGTLGVLGTGLPIGASFKKYLGENADVRTRLGNSLSGEALLLKEKLAVQLFTNGALVCEKDTGRVWADFHVARQSPGSAVGLFIRLPQIKLSKGEYGVTAYKDRVLVRQNETGKQAEVLVGQPGKTMPEHVQMALDKDAKLAGRLGQAVSEEKSLFDDAVRLQVFEGGAILYEPATKKLYKLWHKKRVVVKDA